MPERLPRRRRHRCLERHRRGDRPPARPRPRRPARARGPPRGAPARARRGARRELLAVDLTEDDAPARVRDAVQERHGRLDLLVNNAGAAWRATFAEGGWENVRRHMELNFDAVVRLTEALLPLLRDERAERDRQRREHRGARRAARVGRLLGEQVRARGLVGRARGRGGAQRRPRRARPPRLHHHGGLPAGRAHRQPAHAAAGLDPRTWRAGDRRRRPGRQGRALRAAPVRARRGRAGAGAAPRAPRHGRQDVRAHGHPDRR